MEFTDDQKKAIKYAGRNLHLIACAGSGKTEVVAQRIVQLLRRNTSNSLAPKNIIAFTFTEKAATELKERIVTRTKEAMGDLHGLAEMFVGTIHAFCLELLKNEVPDYLKCEVLNEIQQSLFVNRYSQLSGLTKSKDLSERKLKRYIDTQNYISALTILRECDLNYDYLNSCSVYNDGLPSYTDCLSKYRVLDYSSILEIAFGILDNNEEVQARLADRVKYVVVDEYQDVNPIQEAIVYKLHQLGAGVCVVGDDDQTIYQWRGSDVNYIIDFKNRYPETETIALQSNFRSSIGVVDTARRFVEKISNRIDKHMTPASDMNYEVGDIVALSFDCQEEEAAYIVQTIQSLRGIVIKNELRGLSWSDIVILLRSVKNNAAPITNALQQANIPFIVKGMTDLFGAPEIEAAKNIFDFLCGQITDASVVEQSWIDAEIAVVTTSLQCALRKVARIRENLEDETEWDKYSIQRVFLNFLEDAEIVEESIPKERRETVFYNLGKFSELITDFETIHYKSNPKNKFVEFSNFLRYGAQNSYPEGWQESNHYSPDAVQIMTIHQSKGNAMASSIYSCSTEKPFSSKKIRW